MDLTVQQVQQHDKETTRQRSHCISFDCLCIIFGDLGKTPSPSSSRLPGPAFASAPTRPLNFRRRNGFLLRSAYFSVMKNKTETMETETETETETKRSCALKR